MSRYIDADALKEHIEVITYEGMWHESEVDEFVSVENIDNAPSIDIVRCKECKYWNKSATPALQSPNAHPCFRAFSIMLSRADDFCSRGERRTDE